MYTHSHNCMHTCIHNIHKDGYVLCMETDRQTNKQTNRPTYTDTQIDKSRSHRYWTFHDKNSLRAVSKKNQMENYLVWPHPHKMVDRIWASSSGTLHIPYTDLGTHTHTHTHGGTEWVQRRHAANKSTPEVYYLMLTWSWEGRQVTNKHAEDLTTLNHKIPLTGKQHHFIGTNINNTGWHQGVYKSMVKGHHTHVQ